MLFFSSFWISLSQDVRCSKYKEHKCLSLQIFGAKISIFRGHISNWFQSLNRRNFPKLYFVLGLFRFEDLYNHKSFDAFNVFTYWLHAWSYGLKGNHLSDLHSYFGGWDFHKLWAAFTEYIRIQDLYHFFAGSSANTSWTANQRCYGIFSVFEVVFGGCWGRTTEIYGWGHWKPFRKFGYLIDVFITDPGFDFCNTKICKNLILCEQWNSLN